MPAAEPPPARARDWAVAAPHRLASEAGVQAFAAGGNAIDAAIAAAAVLAVVYPNQCTIGGDLIALVGLPDGTAHVLNASGRAPQGVDVDAVRSAHRRMPESGALTVTVPGVVDGWHELARRWGRRPVAEATTRAAGLARDGVPVSPGLARGLVREASRVAADPGTAGIFLRDGAVLRPGDALVQPRLADTLDLIGAGGPAAFYTGPVAAALVKTLQQNGSAMSVADLAAHRSTLEEPLSASFGGETYLSSGGNTQGTFFLAGMQTLDAVRQLLGEPLDPLGAHAALLAPVFVRLSVERDARLGDAGSPSSAARLGEVLSAGFAQRLAGQVLAGSPGPVPRSPAAPTPSGDTVAIVASDGEGHWVCIIQSIFQGFGSGILDPATGVLLHSRGSAFTLAPGAAGELAGGRRPPHTLMPVLVRDAAGLLVGAHGTMGGRAQPQIHTHLALQLALGRTPVQAVGAPRWVVGKGETGTPDGWAVLIEGPVPAAARTVLAGTGLAQRDLPANDDLVGHAQVIRLVGSADQAATPTTPTTLPSLVAASDPRADGAALTGAG